MKAISIIPLCVLLAMPICAQAQEKGANVSFKFGDGVTVASANEKFSLNLKADFSAGVNFDLDKEDRKSVV